jgi:hypothetical protein
VSPDVTLVVLGSDATDRNRLLVDPHADDAHPDAALHRGRRHPSCPIADLNEKQHALAFQMRDLVVAACGASC